VTADGLLDGLDPEQREVATALDGSVRVLAGAGTGKTRAITHRIAYGVVTGAFAPTEGLAVTFTTRAAGELRSRLARLGAVGVQARTFHSAALRQARYFWPQVYGSELPSLISSKLGLLGEAVGRNRLKASQADLRDLASEIEWAKVSNVRPDDYAALAPRSGRAIEGYDVSTVASVYAAYEEVKRNRQRIDMEDVLLCAAAVLSDDERVAATVRRQYQWFVVDEFQDVSPIQSALLDLWLGGRNDLCVVGDPAQTIYSFAGASADYLLDFPAKFPGTTSITLMRNYRSTPEVIGAANTVMGPQIGRGAVELKATRDAGPAVTYAGHGDEVEEATAIATEISRLVARGAAPADIAVLFRINAQSENFEEALSERGVPFVVRGVERFFDRPEVRQAMTLLRGATRARRDGTDEAGASAPSDDDTAGEKSGLAGEVAAVLTSMGWSAEAPTTRGNVRDRWESLQAVISMADEIATDHPGVDLAGFVAELQRRADTQHAPVADGVTLTTLHAAKGLEWPVVYCAGMHEGTMPIVYAESPAQVEEERRLLYVGLTRARDALHVSWAAARSPGGRGSRGASRFLDALVGERGRPAASASGSRAKRRTPSKASLSSCRVCGRPLTDAKERKLGRCADCPSTYDEQVYDALRAWRRARAAEEQLPAYCVFTDATMTALAEIKPADASELVRVPGIGAAKVDKYGDDILRLCSGDSAGDATDGPSGESVVDNGTNEGSQTFFEISR
jgi:DNA helicase-2/ATP-dependent DNA helicase PcrA